jgi:hypothetical protein
MPIAPFIPMIAQGVGAIAGHFGGKQAEKNAAKRSPEEMAALTGAQGQAGTMGQAGQNMLGQAQPWLTQTGNYYNTLLRGNRAAMSQAVAGPTAQLNDVYKGEERNLQRSGVQGAARDVAAADIGRRRSSQIAGLTTGVQPWAATQLGSLGTNTGQLGGQLSSNAGNIYQNLLGAGANNRAYARKEGRDTAAQIGAFTADIGEFLGKKPWKKSGGGGPPRNDAWNDEIW